MKVKRIKIGIKSWEENKRELRAIFRRVGQTEQIPEEEALYFIDLETFRKCLTPKRLALLWTVVEKRPQSVRELAALVKRELKNVSEDLEYLSQVGLVELRPSSAHGNARAPVVPYDRVDFSLDLRRRAA
jgi:predicted transcriptional regulator